MDKWVSLKEASKITGRPERTLRHYAVEGRIDVKKEGRFWFCNVTSLQKIGTVRPSVTTPVSPPKNEPTKFLPPKFQREIRD